MSYLLGFLTGFALAIWLAVRWGAPAFSMTWREFVSHVIRSSDR